jgi:hypothetical protein
MGKRKKRGVNGRKRRKRRRRKRKERRRIKKSSNWLGEEGEGTHLMSVYQIIHDPPSDPTKVHWSND